MYALGAAVSMSLIFRTSYPERDWTIIPETRREQTAAQHAQWQRNKEQVARWNTFTRDSYSFKILIFRKLLTMSSVKTDVNPSDIGTKAVGRERFHRIEINAWHGYWAERDEFTWQTVRWRRVTVEISGYEYDGLVESNDRHMWACVDLWIFSKCNEGRLANLTQPRDARRRACWTRVMLLHSGRITAWYGRHDSDILLCTQTSWAQVESHRKQFSSLCTAHFAPVLRRFPTLAKQEKISVLYWFVKTRNSLPPSSSRSFRTQSYRSFITGQCLDSGRFLQVHLSRWMCNQFAFHHQFRIVFFLHVNPMDKEHKDPETIDLEAPRLAQYMQTAWKKHQNTVYWVDIKLAQKKGLKFYQTRSNAIILYNTLPSLLYSESC